MSKTSCIFIPAKTGFGWLSIPPPPLPPQLSCPLYTEPPPHMTLSVDQKLEQDVKGGLPGDRVGGVIIHQEMRIFY